MWTLSSVGLTCLMVIVGAHKMHDAEHGIVMGVPWAPCDNGKDGINVDWDPISKEEFTCHYSESVDLSRLLNSPSTGYKDIVETPNTHVEHKCLNESIIYDPPMPLSGDHRPLWPKFGDYTYLPPQRWVHSLEHGAIVLLYHPCVAGPDLKKIKSLVQDCLRKHVITPYKLITDNMPFALLAFGHARLFHSVENTSMADMTSFIKEYALRGPESRVIDDGQYSVGRKQAASVVSDLEDSTICPGM